MKNYKKAGKGLLTTAKENSALVSIVIPAYNTEQYIHRAIESSIRQTYKNIEIIIIDDGSTDGTLNVAQSYESQDSRVRVIHQENKGVSSARNHGIREAKGEYIMFLDSDDWFEDNAVEVLVDMQLKYPDKLIAADFNRVEYDENDCTFHILQYFFKEYKDKILQIDSIEEALSEWGKARLQFIHAKLFNTSLIQKYELQFNENVHYGEDALFVFDYLHKVNGVLYINEAIMKFLRHSDSTTGKSYETRKHFEDYPLMMINHPDNTPNVIEKLKLYHTGALKWELSNALKTKTSMDEIKYLKRKTCLYLRNFLLCKKVSIKDKLVLIIKIYMPVPFVRVMLFVSDFIKNTVKPSR